MKEQEVIETKLRSYYLKMNNFLTNINRKEDFGFKIFNSPPLHQPDVLFIGYQPGGGKEDFAYEISRGSHLSWPQEAEYATASWVLAKRMREMFEPSIDLQKCVGLNAIFLRSPDIDTYNKNLTKKDRQAVAQFCADQVGEMIELLDPKFIVAIGFQTLNLFCASQPDLLSPKNRVLARRGMIGTRKAISVLHLSGAQISKDDRSLIASHIISYHRRHC